MFKSQLLWTLNFVSYLFFIIWFFFLCQWLWRKVVCFWDIFYLLWTLSKNVFSFFFFYLFCICVVTFSISSDILMMSTTFSNVGQLILRNMKCNLFDKWYCQSLIHTQYVYMWASYTFVHVPDKMVACVWHRCMQCIKCNRGITTSWSGD